MIEPCLPSGRQKGSRSTT